MRHPLPYGGEGASEPKDVSGLLTAGSAASWDPDLGLVWDPPGRSYGTR